MWLGRTGSINFTDSLIGMVGSVDFFDRTPTPPQFRTLTPLPALLAAALLEAAPRLRVISTMAVGYDHIDADAATHQGILVCHTPGVLTETTADFAFALLLAAARRRPEGERAAREGRWTTWHPSFLLGQDVYAATLGIVGLGQIGQAVARRARGFQMRVLYHSRTRKPELEQELRCSS